MRNNTLSIEINTPVKEVFEFTLNPNNTKLWIKSIAHEEINTETTQIGTHYKNLSTDGAWNEYEVTELVPNETFTFRLIGGDYFVRYDFEPTQNGTNLKYTEWVTEGELQSPFTSEPLQALKLILETKKA